MSRIFLFDSNVLSLLLRANAAFDARLARELSAGADIIASSIAYFEVRRGLLKMGGLRFLQDLDDFVATAIWADFTRGDSEEAASLWVKVNKAGRPREDADLLIAAQANRRGAVVVKCNLRHFHGIANEFESW